MNKERVVVLGASNKPERYAYKAIKALLASGHEVLPVNPALKEIMGIPVVRSMAEITGNVDTVTLYIGSDRVATMKDEIIALKPKRIISNPGTESEALRDAAMRSNIDYLEGCTLVMLSTGQF
jgi:uncharacterized protein